MMTIIIIIMINGEREDSLSLVLLLRPRREYESDFSNYQIDLRSNLKSHNLSPKFLVLSST